MPARRVLPRLTHPSRGKPACCCPSSSTPPPPPAPTPCPAPPPSPFVAGEEVTVLSGYGPTAGSSLHKDRAVSFKANDHLALDLTLERYPAHGKGQPVVAPLAGVVVKAGWATAGWANYGQRII